MDLNKKIFGSVTTKEIIGSEPPLYPNTADRLENEFNLLVDKLEKKSKETLEKVLKEQKEVIKQMNGMQGAMALAQDKMKLFASFNSKYIQAVENKLKSLS